MKKIDLAKHLMQKNSEVFMCPICGMDMQVSTSKSLVCPNRHCFDVARQGYVNLLKNSIHTDYDKDMLESRNIICKYGFFDELLIEINSIINEYCNKDNQIRILDAGCGEGSHTVKIAELLRKGGFSEVHPFGIDISKHGIYIAAREYSGVIWSVADLANLPFKERKFDAIVNILSPSNYSEFKRVLKKDGLLIKVVPNSNYLKELRNVFYDNTDKQSYSNGRVINYFSDNFNLVDTKDISYMKTLDEETMNHLVKMTPLSWGADEEKKKKIVNGGIQNITIDFSIIIGKNI